MSGGSKYTVPAVVGATLLSSGVYMMRGRPSATEAPAQNTATSAPRPDADEVERKKQQAQSKRDNGISGAGVGMTSNTGGAELSTGSKAGNRTGPQHGGQTISGDVNREDLPSGGVGGGHGGGNDNSRTSVEIGKGGTQGSKSFFLGMKLQGTAGTGGSTAGGQQYDVDPKDTRIKSHHADTPSNRGGSPFDKHRRDVTAVSETSSKPGKE
ncbi:hypothetical protein HYQ45_010792 [Verticillium longisporum]|uniref:Uncharacterized protein n=1 Tax=Verticillium longisporum TaxID=100787 RepID=A0A8I2ZFR7_VERLO|nr:hypothetical protein HYQ45_010792 [Verticillium longisporum]